MSSILQSIPSAMKIREELEQMVLADLLGPAGGPSEEIDEQSVRDRYLVGMLAPKRQELSPEEFDELAEGGSGSIEEGSADYTALAARTMFPSSFGMTFCADLEASHLQIIARWGHYAKTESETLTNAAGIKRHVWKRSQREGISEPVPLKPGRMRWTPDPEFPEVQVQGIIRKRKRFWSLTLFLVNGQDEPKKLRDKAWLFQPELIVQSPDGKPIFQRQTLQRDRSKADPVTYAEEREMNMHYRHCVEFGVGHGVSIHAECPEGECDRAVRISTKVAPAYEVSQTTPPTCDDVPLLSGLVLDMRELGDTPTAEFDKKIRPLEAKASAIDGRMYKANGPIWHKKDRDSDLVPSALRNVDTQSSWSKSGYRGWVQGYRLLLQGLVFPYPVPIWAGWRPNNEGEAVIAQSALKAEQLPITSVLLGDETFGGAPFTKAYWKAGGWVLTPKQLPRKRRTWKNNLYDYRKQTIELLFQRIIQSAGLKECPVKGNGRNGAFVLASVWSYKVCFLGDYREGKPSAHVKEQLDCARWRIKT